ncbi:MAG: serine/threonine protein kinase, partial [Myxococcota bacterium]|nr:serine/threonine protein kinase [Myxococcota bacterium]
MSQRFIRCPHCSLPHDALQPTCPSSGKTPTGPRAAEAPFNVRASLPPRFAPIPALKKTVLRRDLVGTTVGRRYAILRVLGGGGTATVFEAEHLTMGRSVAVKVLHPEQAKKREAVQRFYREARAAGCIAHPNVCEVYDLDILDDGSPYLVMERLVGATLARRIAEEQKLPLYDLMTILIQILSAIGAAHDRGIVHR